VSQSDPWLRFRFPLIEPDVRVSRIRLSDWISREGSHGCAAKQLTELLDPKGPEDPLVRKPHGAALMLHLVSTPEKVAHALSNVPIHGSISHEPGPVAEVGITSSKPRFCESGDASRSRLPTSRVPAFRRPMRRSAMCSLVRGR